MKPTLVFAVVMMVAIVVMSSFDLHLVSTTPITLTAEESAQILYVCPASSPIWDSVAMALRPFTRPLTICFFFAGLILMFVWGWVLYQNLLKDKFDRKSFSNPWGFTKVWFWAIVIIVLATATPNYFRTVHLDGARGEYVLCERTTYGAKAAYASKVML